MPPSVRAPSQPRPRSWREAWRRCCWTGPPMPAWWWSVVTVKELRGHARRFPPLSPWSAGRVVRSRSCGVRRRKLSPPRRGPVVVGVDGSPAGTAALDLAAELAAAFGARLVAVQAWTDVVADTSGGLHRSAGGGTELAAHAAELLDTQLTPVRDRHPGWRWNAYVVNDTALSALLDQGTGGPHWGGGPGTAARQPPPAGWVPPAGAWWSSPCARSSSLDQCRRRVHPDEQDTLSARPEGGR